MKSGDKSPQSKARRARRGGDTLDCGDLSPLFIPPTCRRLRRGAARGVAVAVIADQRLIQTNASRRGSLRSNSPQAGKRLLASGEFNAQVQQSELFRSLSVES